MKLLAQNKTDSGIFATPAVLRNSMITENPELIFTGSEVNRGSVLDNHWMPVVISLALVF